MKLIHLIENKHKFKIKSLRDLKLSHGSDFLNELTRLERADNSLKDARRTLTNFYVYLSKKGVISEISPTEFEEVEGPNGTYYKSPFKNLLTSETKNTSKEVEHTFPYEYIPVFLEVANLIAKPIVFGIYLQIFGGLRVGEVVNLKRTQLKRSVGNGEILLKINTNNFRTDIKNSNGGYPKKGRSQKVYVIKDWFDVLYKDHIDLYKPKDKSGALMVNRDGKAMTTQSYSQYFNKVKKYFTELLMNHGSIEDKILAKHLKNQKWSTHIGRGIFSNMVAENSDNPAHIAHDRGDKDLTSALFYLGKTNKMGSKLAEAFFNMNNHYIPKLIDQKEEDINDI